MRMRPTKWSQLFNFGSIRSQQSQVLLLSKWVSTPSPKVVLPIITRWIKTCFESHTLCKDSSEMTSPRTPHIHLRWLATTRLCFSDDYKDCPKYACTTLNHCWRKVSHIFTLKKEREYRAIWGNNPSRPQRKPTTSSTTVMYPIWTLPSLNDRPAPWIPRLDPPRAYPLLEIPVFYWDPSTIILGMLPYRT